MSDSEQLAVSDSEQPAPLAFSITRGGEPTDEELAAVAIALSPGPRPDGEAAGRPSAWREAALLEAVGFRPFVSVDDVAAYHRSLA